MSIILNVKSAWLKAKHEFAIAVLNECKYAFTEFNEDRKRFKIDFRDIMVALNLCMSHLSLWEMGTS